MNVGENRSSELRSVDCAVVGVQQSSVEVEGDHSVQLELRTCQHNF